MGRRTESYNIYIYKVLKQVHPEIGVSKRAMQVLNSFVHDIFERICAEAGKCTRYSGRQTCGVREIKAATALVLPVELAKQSQSIAKQSLEKYMATTAILAALDTDSALVNVPIENECVVADEYKSSTPKAIELQMALFQDVVELNAILVKADPTIPKLKLIPNLELIPKPETDLTPTETIEDEGWRLKYMSDGYEIVETPRAVTDASETEQWSMEKWQKEFDTMLGDEESLGDEELELELGDDDE